MAKQCGHVETRNDYEHMRDRASPQRPPPCGPRVASARTAADAPAARGAPQHPPAEPRAAMKPKRCAARDRGRRYSRSAVCGSLPPPPDGGGHGRRPSATRPSGRPTDTLDRPAAQPAAEVHPLRPRERQSSRAGDGVSPPPPMMGSATSARPSRRARARNRAERLRAEPAAGAPLVDERAQHTEAREIQGASSPE